MKKLLIVNQQQFGYLSDTYNYCLHLRREFDISFVCWDYGRKRIPMDGVNVIYVSRAQPKWLRWGAFISAALSHIRSNEYAIAFVIYFRGCSFLRLRAPRFRAMVMDVRTGSVRHEYLPRTLENMLLRIESVFFRHVTIISESLMHMLGIDARKSVIFPVGGPDPELPEKQFDEIRLLYVGTFRGRNIHKTVEGISRFHHENMGHPPIRYDIIGDGSEEEMIRLRSAIEKSPCRDGITMHGRIPHSELRPHFAKANIGVAFVPITAYYQCQPVTKVYEYLLAGMPVLATRTNENIRVITPGNGVLFADTVEGFAEGLKALVTNLPGYDSRAIKSSGTPYSWRNIVQNSVVPYFESLARHPRVSARIAGRTATPPARGAGLPSSSEL